ncbi:MAG: hypothetical protein IKS76_01550 [Paludibacteraceae bacterium]|nr:hypothetical protein [Paludibacteraceae bacterium]
MEGIVEILGNGFFPIAMCGLLLFGGWKIFHEGIDTVNKITDAHSEETKELTKVIENNTQVITGVVERLDKVETKLDDIEDKVDALDICAKKED